MPLPNYGVLKGRAIRRRPAESANPHYQMQVIDDEDDWRVSVNVRARLAPSEVEYLIDDDFRHPVTAGLGALPLGFTHLDRRPGGLALDYIRFNLFDRRAMRPLPFAAPGRDDDLNEALDRIIRPVIADETALVYAFGERWGPEGERDKIFGFRPGNGIHNIHMNQGNHREFMGQDGVWQDGGLLLHLPAEGRWVGLFLKFQSQTWHTDDATGRRIEADGEHVSGSTATVGRGEPDLIVRIVAALVNPPGPPREAETVTLLNTSPHTINLTGWAIADRQKNRQRLGGRLPAGGTVVVRLGPPVTLGNDGGIITLLDAQGLRVHGVAYTAGQAGREGWTIAF